jgi:hypothetical protein
MRCVYTTPGVIALYTVALSTSPKQPGALTAVVFLCMHKKDTTCQPHHPPDMTETTGRAAATNADQTGERGCMPEPACPPPLLTLLLLLPLLLILLMLLLRMLWLPGPMAAACGCRHTSPNNACVTTTPPQRTQHEHSTDTISNLQEAGLENPPPPGLSTGWLG